MSKPTAKSAQARWALQDAKNRFSEVVEAALRGEPQVVTRRGIETAVIIAHEDYARIIAGSGQRPSFSQYLLSRGGTVSGEPFVRIRLPARDEV